MFIYRNGLSNYTRSEVTHFAKLVKNNKQPRESDSEVMHKLSQALNIGNHRQLEGMMFTGCCKRSRFIQGNLS